MKGKILHLKEGKAVEDAEGEIRNLFKLDKTSNKLIIRGIGGDVYGFGSDPVSFKRNGLTLKCSECVGILVSHSGVLSLHSPEEIEISISPDGDVFEIEPKDAELSLAFSKGSFDSVSDVLKGSKRKYFRPKSTLELMNGSLSGFIPKRIDFLPKSFWRVHVEDISRNGNLALHPIFVLDPSDGVSRNVWDQFLIDGIMIAPKVEGTDGRVIYIPKGTWRDPKTGEMLTPGLRFFESDETIILLGEDSLIYETSSEGIEISANLVERISKSLVFHGVWKVIVEDELIKVERKDGSKRLTRFHFRVWSRDTFNEVSFTARDSREVRLN